MIGLPIRLVDSRYTCLNNVLIQTRSENIIIIFFFFLLFVCNLVGADSCKEVQGLENQWQIHEECTQMDEDVAWGWGGGDKRQRDLTI